MEREYKWTADRAQFDAICQTLSVYPDNQLSMDATYFDTPDGILRKQKIGLRLRCENGQTVCCMKKRNTARNGLHIHEEYELPAQTLAQGLSQLPTVGAPADLCQTLLHTNLVSIAQVRFDRIPVLWRTTAFSAELSFDRGYLANSMREIPFCEIECEYKSGDPTAFESACTTLSEKFTLCAQPHSKLARALSL